MNAFTLDDYDRLLLVSQTDDGCPNGCDDLEPDDDADTDLDEE